MILDNGPWFPPVSSFVVPVFSSFPVLPDSLSSLRVGLEDPTLESCPIDEKPRFEQGKTQKELNSWPFVHNVQLRPQCFCHV